MVSSLEESHNACALFVLPENDCSYDFLDLWTSGLSILVLFSRQFSNVHFQLEIVAFSETQRIKELMK